MFPVVVQSLPPSTAASHASLSKATADNAMAALSISAGSDKPLYKSTLSIAERVQVAMSVGEEVLTVEELEKMFIAKDHPIVYDGFEPSGRMHIAQGVLR